MRAAPRTRLGVRCLRSSLRLPFRRIRKVRGMVWGARRRESNLTGVCAVTTRRHSVFSQNALPGRHFRPSTGFLPVPLVSSGFDEFWAPDGHRDFGRKRSLSERFQDRESEQSKNSSMRLKIEDRLDLRRNFPDAPSTILLVQPVPTIYPCRPDLLTSSAASSCRKLVVLPVQPFQCGLMKSPMISQGSDDMSCNSGEDSSKKTTANQ